jgi:hypothetical protein
VLVDDRLNGGPVLVAAEPTRRGQHCGTEQGIDVSRYLLLLLAACFTEPAAAAAAAFNAAAAGALWSVSQLASQQFSPHQSLAVSARNQEQQMPATNLTTEVWLIAPRLTSYPGRQPPMAAVDTGKQDSCKQSVSSLEQL